MNYRLLRVVGIALVVVIVGSAPLGTASAVDGAAGDSTPEGTTSGEGAGEAAPNVSAVEALRLVENVTNGTSVGLDLEDENGTPVYDVTVVQQNGVLMEAIVDGTEPRLLAVTTEPGEVIEEDDGGVFGEGAEDDAWNRPADDFRSATEAVTAAKNASTGNATADPNVTTTGVELRRNESAYVYVVELRSPEGDLTAVRVEETTGAVLSVDELE